MSTQQDVPGDAQRPEPEIHDEPGLRLVDNTTSGRVELWLDQTFIGFEGVEKHPDGTLELQHTIIDEKFGRRGYARALVTMVLDRLKAEGDSISPECSYVEDYLQRYPEYQEMVHEL